MSASPLSFRPLVLGAVVVTWNAAFAWALYLGGTSLATFESRIVAVTALSCAGLAMLATAWVPAVRRLVHRPGTVNRPWELTLWAAMSLILGVLFLTASRPTP